MIIANYLSEMWAAVAPAVGNHLWQSTLFAVVAGLLTLMLRKNQARARYWLWMAASLKFLIPFSLLVGIGTHVIGSDLGWSRAAGQSKAEFYFAMDEFSQPFTQPAARVVSEYSCGRFAIFGECDASASRATFAALAVRIRGRDFYLVRAMAADFRGDA